MILIYLKTEIYLVDICNMYSFAIFATIAVYDVDYYMTAFTFL